MQDQGGTSTRSNSRSPFRSHMEGIEEILYNYRGIGIQIELKDPIQPEHEITVAGTKAEKAKKCSYRQTYLKMNSIHQMDTTMPHPSHNPACLFLIGRKYKGYLHVRHLKLISSIG